MCSTPKYEPPKPTVIAAPGGMDGNRQADIEARMRRARSGALANILTSATGIPSTAQLGVPAS